MIRLFRLRHWLKNLLIFIVPVLNYSVLNLQNIVDLVSGFVLLCLTASAVYIFNDIIDLEDDRSHPLKRMRPIASGEVSVLKAVFAMAGLFLFIFIGIWFFNKSILMPIVLYLFLNVVYSLGFKKFKYLDILFLVVFLMIRFVELKIRTVTTISKSRGYTLDDLNHINISRYVLLFLSLISYLQNALFNWAVKGMLFFVMAVSALYLVLVLCEDDGPEDVVDLILSIRVLIPIIFNIFVVIYCLH